MWHPERNKTYKELNTILKNTENKMKIILLCAGKK